MGRPSKPIAMSNKHLTNEEIEKRSEIENKLRGNSNKIRAPSYLTDEQKKIFKKIKDELSSSEILGNIDIYILATCAISLDRIQYIETSINKNKDLLLSKGYMATKDKYTKDFFRCCSELCLSPASRSKIGLKNVEANEKKEDPLYNALFEDDE